MLYAARDGQCDALDDPSPTSVDRYSVPPESSAQIEPSPDATAIAGPRSRSDFVVFPVLVSTRMTRDCSLHATHADLPCNGERHRRPVRAGRGADLERPRAGQPRPRRWPPGRARAARTTTPERRTVAVSHARAAVAGFATTFARFRPCTSSRRSIDQGALTFDFAIPCEVFGLDRSDIVDPWYEFLVVAAGDRRVRTQTGFVIDAPHGLDELDRADTIVVPGWSDPDDEPSDALKESLVAAHAPRRAARVALHRRVRPRGGRPARRPPRDDALDVRRAPAAAATRACESIPTFSTSPTTAS